MLLCIILTKHRIFSTFISDNLDPNTLSLIEKAKGTDVTDKESGFAVNFVLSLSSLHKLQSLVTFQRVQYL